ncbi:MULTISPECIES: hemolysin III family protein [unclassified Vibrio]|uniref:Hemolysin III family protein n=1 Tax=Vibrio sp. HB236076 TaxID=3232307 RepID=A0AB39HE21_9VIBR|nr:hemolysin III family protein [Vibrio sp. HB161653]MDP5255651.1 hemolysin III family protein [Vibrio sp. HB161653]
MNTHNDALSSYSKNEERLNAITHALGAMASLIATLFLLSHIPPSEELTLMSIAVYGASLVTLFTASTLYHSIFIARARRWLKVFDHCAIYLLIAGTYTPFLLIGLGTPLAMGLIWVIWFVALIGVLFKLRFVGRYKRFSVALYLLMGWLSLIAIYQMWLLLPLASLVLLAAGGVTYTLGVGFYLAKTLPYHHAIWHVFVLGGATCHFIAVAYLL